VQVIELLLQKLASVSQNHPLFLHQYPNESIGLGRSELWPSSCTSRGEQSEICGASFVCLPHPRKAEHGVESKAPDCYVLELCQRVCSCAQPRGSSRVFSFFIATGKQTLGHSLPQFTIFHDHQCRIADDVRTHCGTGSTGYSQPAGRCRAKAEDSRKHHHRDRWTGAQPVHSRERRPGAGQYRLEYGAGMAVPSGHVQRFACRSRRQNRVFAPLVSFSAKIINRCVMR